MSGGFTRWSMRYGKLAHATLAGAATAAKSPVYRQEGLYGSLKARKMGYIHVGHSTRKLDDPNPSPRAARGRKS